MTTELVIFDCDGVLIDSEVISARMLIEELKGYGVEIDLPFVARKFLGRSYPTVLKEVRESFGIVLPDRFEADYRARLLSAFENGLKVMPGVAEVIGALGVPYCAATSSSSERARRSLEISGLASLFGERVYTASMVERGKPAPDLFLFAAREMKADPAACLVIEDSLMGLVAARAAGMEVWRFTGGSHLRGLDEPEPEEARPARRIASWGEFFDARPDLRRGGAGR